MCENNDKVPVLKVPDGKVSYSIRKVKNVTDYMCFIIKRNEQEDMVIEFKCNDTYNTKIKWNIQLCKNFLKDLQEDRIHVLKVNDEENSISIIGRLFLDSDQFAWRLPNELKGKVNSGDWLKIPCVNGLRCVYTDEIVPTYKLTFFPEKVILGKNANQKLKLMTNSEYWEFKFKKIAEKRERKKRKRERLLENNQQVDPVDAKDK